MLSTVLPLKGYKSVVAFHAFNALLLGFKMLPAYLAEDYATFYSQLDEKSDSEKETVIREAVAFVHLGQDEVEALLSFVKDKNGLPYNQASIKGLSLSEIYEAMVLVCLEIGKLKIKLVSEGEKKN